MDESSRNIKTENTLQEFRIDEDQLAEPKGKNWKTIFMLRKKILLKVGKN
jgi:hypothetical protein